jgi:hypothetical protein
MKSLRLSIPVVALVLAMAVPLGAGPATPSDDTRTGSLQDQLRQAMPDTPGNTAGHVTHYVLEAVEGVEVGLTVAQVHVAGLLGLGIEVAGPVAGMAAVYVALGNAHADAINSIITDEMLSGFSRGVVLGADKRSESYVKSNFIKWSPVPNSVYPEYGKRFQNAYNSALIAGYAQGKQLTKEESGAFFSDLFSRMSVHPSVTYGEDSKEWSDRSWIDYYIECAALFRRDHLK